MDVLRRRVLIAIFTLIAIGISLGIFSVAVGSLWVSLTSIIIAMSFVFGNTLKDLFEVSAWPRLSSHVRSELSRCRVPSCTRLHPFSGFTFAVHAPAPRLPDGAGAHCLRRNLLLADAHQAFLDAPLRRGGHHQRPRRPRVGTRGRDEPHPHHAGGRHPGACLLAKLASLFPPRSQRQPSR